MASVSRRHAGSHCAWLGPARPLLWVMPACLMNYPSSHPSKAALMPEGIWGRAALPTLVSTGWGGA